MIYGIQSILVINTIIVHTQELQIVIYIGVIDRINNEQNYIVANYIRNLDIINNNKLKYLHLLNKVTYLRGGRDEYSSFVWCDKREHQYMCEREQYILPYQIMGHTPVQTVSNISGNNLDLYFVDTHSTYRDGTNIGDKTYLVWNDDKFVIEY